MARRLVVAAIQCPLGDDRLANVERVIGHLEEAGRQGVQVALPPELFEGPYFCCEQNEAAFDLAHPMADHPTLARVAQVARAARMVVPVSFFEQDGPHFYNSVAVIDADGQVLGRYRKSHIPDGPGYQEKYYFSPGNSGFRVFSTQAGRIGVGICWDQWFPEAARAMVLGGAEVLLYPSAIGSEPTDPAADTRPMWQRAMVGHAVANLVPVVAANRIGREALSTFYGHSFVADHTGEKVASAGAEDEGLVVAQLDLDAARRAQRAFGFFRDRRPELYGALGAAGGG